MADPINHSSGTGNDPITSYALVGGKVTATTTSGKTIVVNLPTATEGRIDSVAFVSASVVRLSLNTPVETQDVTVRFGMDGIAAAIENNDDRITALEGAGSASITQVTDQSSASTTSYEPFEVGQLFFAKDHQRWGRATATNLISWETHSSGLDKLDYTTQTSSAKKANLDFLYAGNYRLVLANTSGSMTGVVDGDALSISTALRTMGFAGKTDLIRNNLNSTHPIFEGAIVQSSATDLYYRRNDSSSNITVNDLDATGANLTTTLSTHFDPFFPNSGLTNWKLGGTLDQNSLFTYDNITNSDITNASSLVIPTRSYVDAEILGAIGASQDDHVTSATWVEATRTLTLSHVGDPDTVLTIGDEFVELVDNTTSTDITKALTANQGKSLQDQINALPTPPSDWKGGGNLNNNMTLSYTGVTIAELDAGSDNLLPTKEWVDSKITAATSSTGRTDHGVNTVAQTNALAGMVVGDTCFVSNEVGGSIPAFYDGTNWRRVTDRAIVS